MARIDPILAAALGELAQTISQPDFAERLLGFAASLVDSDSTTMTRYSRFSKPDYVIHSEGYSESMAARYLEETYRFDPFYRFWRETERAGVVALSDLSSGDIRRGRYMREFLSPGGIADEIGLFLPPIGGSSIALFLERTTKRFTARERQVLSDAYPLFAGLYRAHLGALFGVLPEPAPTLAALPSLRPVLVTDSNGNRLFANAAWHAEETPELSSALLDRQAVAPDPLPLGDGRVLHGARLDRQFSLAPGGRIWTIEQLAQPPESDLAAAPLFDDELTPREKEIVALVLQGHPTVSIAEKLGLSRGTVKNHRRRIYYKLDITSERELFLLQIERLSRQG